MAIRPRIRSGQCPHEVRLAVTAAGVERSICETCGHISVQFVSEMSGPVTREHFARPADGILDEPDDTPRTPFALEERLGVRRRDRVDHKSLLLSA